MNKQQINYLTSKVREQAATAIREYSKNKLTCHKTEDVVAALEKAGFVPKNDYDRGDLKWSAQYVTLAPTKEMKQNQEDIEAYKAKVNALTAQAIDAAYLGDNKDALAILASFAESLKSLG